MTKYRLKIPGPCGPLETVGLDPMEPRIGLALIAHPHSLYGGSLDNKVVETLAKTLTEHGYVAVRLNFRGVGESAGEFDGGNGEVADILSAAKFIKEKYPQPGLPLILVGFSFGAFVQSKACQAIKADKLILIAPAVNMFDFPVVPANTVIIHGSKDLLVPLEEVKAWAGKSGLPVNLVEGADHFFNQSLDSLRQIFIQTCQLSPFTA
ncbi:MAG: alpha/beta hydrolase [Pseudomonadota bacterium]|nr:alpha/beta hydrolase [Pseudomonadota bacterium]